MTAPAHTRVTCAACESARTAPLKRYLQAQLARCRVCGFVFTSRSPTDAELVAYYSAYGTDWSASPITRMRYRELLASFEPYRKSGRLLDMGCGAGLFLEEARDAGWDVVGSEVGGYALELGRAKGLEIVQAPVSREMFAAGSFDVVCAFEVVEHLRDLETEASVLRHLLRLGGLLYLTTPNWGAATRRLVGERWPVIAYPEHLGYFTRASLQSWLAAFGFVPMRLMSEGFSPANLRRSLGAASAPGSGAGGDEALREAVERWAPLGLGKRLVNRWLSMLHAGDTLKGWFELRSNSNGD